MYDVIFYIDQHGNNEIGDYLELLSRSHQRSDRILLKKIYFQLHTLRIKGPNIREPQAKYLKGYSHPLMELRPILVRIFYAGVDANTYILFHYYVKRKDKTDNREVRKAIRNLDDWLDRRH